MSDSLVDSFIANLEAVAGKAHVVDGPEAAAGTIAQIIAEANLTRAAIAHVPPVLADALRPLLLEKGVQVKEEPFAADSLPLFLDDVQVGITGIDFAIAQTGTMVEVATNDATRLVSSMPRTYIGVFHATEIVPTLLESAPRLRAVFRQHAPNVMVSFISGPSRTGDIEMILTLGVHGPENAHAIIVQEKVS